MHKMLYPVFMLLKAVSIRLCRLPAAASNYYTLVVNKVQYKTYPHIFGKIKIKNKGTLVLGENVKFNCATTFNYVGLYKRCSLAVQKNATITIGDGSGFSGVSLYAKKSITIGSYVNCGGNVSIWDTDFHPLDHAERRIHKVSAIVSKPIVIEDDVFIGANATVLKGVTIGAKSIIGAGSVVTKDVPAGEIWAGNPAIFIRKITGSKLHSGVYHLPLKPKKVC